MDEIADFRALLARQDEAGEAMYRGNPEPWMVLWSQRDPVSLFGAWGPCRTGWADVARTFRWVGGRMSGGRSPRFDVVVSDVRGDLAYSVGYETAELSVDAAPVAPWRLRVSHVYRREDHGWKIVHRHADLPPPDPGR
jgi:ketosteroid isomerase-like protein